MFLVSGIKVSKFCGMYHAFYVVMQVIYYYTRKYHGCIYDLYLYHCVVIDIKYYTAVF
jgi:hypothetical protein